MSTDSSIGTYDSLFDDDTVTLREICFDLDDAQQDVTSNKNMHDPSPSPWCMSSSSSCCSLCRPPIISEAEDDSNAYRPSTDTAFHSSMYHAQTKNHSVSLPRGAVSRYNPQSISLCDSNCMGSPNCLGPSRSLFRVPIKTVEIPRSSMDPSMSTNVDQKAVPIDCNDHLSTSFLPDDALCDVANFLDVASLVRLRECNRKLRQAASKNSAGWQHHAMSLWSSKITVCHAARELLAESHRTSKEETSTRTHPAMEAYKISVTDAATRQEISSEELCFDGSPGESGTSWSFRFKESAGRDWTSWDPWWIQQDARKLVFLRDGTILQAHPRGAGSSPRNYNGTLLYDVFSERSVRRDGVDVPAPRIEMKWRFVRRPLDLAHRPPGAYVRVTVGGRDVPTYVVRRSSNGNWGFILESCWGVYASFDLAPQVPMSAAPRRGQWLLRRNRDENRWVNLEESDGGGGDDGRFEHERLRNVRRRIDLFAEESSMIDDRNTQWREALLYNIGAVTLPDDNVVSQFHNAWRNAM